MKSKDLDLTEGLAAYVRLPGYRQALGLPAGTEEEYRLLAQGEYNRNYVFTHPLTGQELVLRINFGSQMHLERQIEYEYHALNCWRRPDARPVLSMWMEAAVGFRTA